MSNGGFKANGASRTHLKRLLASLCGYSLVWWILFCVIKYISTDIAYPFVGEVNRTAQTISAYAFEVMLGIWACAVIGILLYHWKQILSALERQTEENRRKRDEMLACLAHDLRTPLTSILGYAHLLDQRDQLNTAEARGNVRIILGKAEQLSGMLDEFFELTRLETGSAKLECAEINLAEMLRQLVTEYEPLLAPQKQRLACEIAPCATVSCDASKMERVFDNLMRNAMKYAPPESDIRVCGQIEDLRFHVSFENPSPEIPKEQLSGLFDAFVRLDPARERAEGAGMGLTIVREIVALHGGDTQAEYAGGQLKLHLWMNIIKSS